MESSRGVSKGNRSDRLEVVTLVPTVLAKKGTSFTFMGLPKECRKCQLYFLCSRLIKGVPYKVVRLRKVKHPCKVHDEVQVAVVKIMPLKVMLPSNAAIPGIILRYPWIMCKETSCPHRELCRPKSLKGVNKVKVIKVFPSIFKCRYKELRLALVLPLP